MWIKAPDRNLANWLFRKTKNNFTYKSDGKKDKWKVIAELYNQGVLSLETAVQMLALTDAPAEEIEKIRKDAEDKVALAAKVKGNENTTS